MYPGRTLLRKLTCIRLDRYRDDKGELKHCLHVAWRGHRLRAMRIVCHSRASSDRPQGRLVRAFEPIAADEKVFSGHGRKRFFEVFCELLMLRCTLTIY